MDPTHNHLVVELVARLVIEWLAQRASQPAAEVAEVEPGIWGAKLGPTPVTLAVAGLASGAPQAPPDWQSRLTSLSARLAVDGGALVWAPAGADVPGREPALSSTVEALEAGLRALGPGETGEAALPIEIRISKRDDNGAYVSAFGGLAQHWARFTDRVQGYFQIDATELHRLPEGDQHRDELIDRLIEASRSLQLGAETTVDAFDYWRVQRLRDGAGTGIVALPPDDDSEIGAPLRKRLRTVLRDEVPRLAPHVAARLLVLVGHYPSLDDEPVGAALRSQDPSLFGGIDLIVLVADGRVRPLMDITRSAALQPA